MSATFITWGIPAIALSLAGLAYVWAWWRSRQLTKEYPDSAIADSYRASRPPICSVTGGPMVRGTRPMTITYKDQSITFDMPGWYSGNESVHTGEDMEVSDSALRELKFKANKP